MKRRTALHVMAAATALAPFGTIRASGADERVLKMLVGFPAGSAPDVVARVVGKPLSEALRRTVVVDNRAGVGGQLALAALKQTPPDGSTVAITPLSALTLYPSTYAKLPYDSAADFAPICTVGVTDFAFVVAADHPARTLQEFVAWCKANPGKGDIGNPGLGSSPHLMAWTFTAAAGLGVEHVSYRTPPQIAQEIIGGILAGGMATSSLFGELVKSGKLRVLATTGTQRSSLFSQAPTFSESGYPAVVNQEWYAIFARADTPSAAAAAMAAAAKDLSARDEVRSSLSSLGFVPEIHDAAWLTQHMRTEAANWREIVARAGFKAQ